MKPRLREKFETELVAKLKEKHNYSNVMQIPRLTKICLNQGVGAGVADKKLVDTAVEEMSTIAGQKAVPHSQFFDPESGRLRWPWSAQYPKAGHLPYKPGADSPD